MNPFARPSTARTRRLKSRVRCRGNGSMHACKNGMRLHACMDGPCRRHGSLQHALGPDFGSLVIPSLAFAVRSVRSRQIPSCCAALMRSPARDRPLTQFPAQPFLGACSDAIRAAILCGADDPPLACEFERDFLGGDVVANRHQGGALASRDRPITTVQAAARPLVATRSRTGSRPRAALPW